MSLRPRRAARPRLGPVGDLERAAAASKRWPAAPPVRGRSARSRNRRSAGTGRQSDDRLAAMKAARPRASTGAGDAAGSGPAASPTRHGRRRARARRHIQVTRRSGWRWVGGHGRRSETVHQEVFVLSTRVPAESFADRGGQADSFRGAWAIGAHQRPEQVEAAETAVSIRSIGGQAGELRRRWKTRSHARPGQPHRRHSNAEDECPVAGGIDGDGNRVTARPPRPLQRRENERWTRKPA